MARLPRRQIRRIIKKYATARTVRRYADRRTQGFDSDGDPIILNFTEEMVQVHDQPLTGKMIKYLPEGQRLDDVRRGWTIETDKIKEQDQIELEGFTFTVNGVQPFVRSGHTTHTEFNLLRTGEQDNLWT